MKSILKLSQKLISIPSTRENISALHQALKLTSRSLSDFTVEKFEKDKIPSLLIHNQKKGTKKFKIILNGHLDVVAAPDQLFTPILKGNRLYGRGAIDMKAAVAVMTQAFKDTAKQLSYPLALQLVTDEEIGGFKGTHHQVKQGVKAELVIVGEATNLDLEIAAKAPLWLKLTSQGKTGHSAYLWQGENAIKIMADNIQKISRLFPVPQKETWKTTCNISVIHGGKTTNQVPDECSLKLDIRRIPQDSTQNIINSIKQTITHTQVEVLENEPTHQLDSSHPLFKTLQQTIKTHQGQTPKLIKKHGASDARHYAGSKINAVCFGPIGDGLHSNHEWVNLKSLSTYYSILKTFLKSL